MIFAIAVLFPREVRNELKALYDQGLMSVEDVVSTVELPESYCEWLVTEDADRMYDAVDRILELGGNSKGILPHSRVEV